MPLAPLRPCAGSPTCPFYQGQCPNHANQRERQRGNRIARGYDRHWLRLRAWFMRQPENQLCRLCQQQGRVELAKECDHVIPFVGLNDPNRLNPKNLQALCVQHHREKHG